MLSIMPLENIAEGGEYLTNFDAPFIRDPAPRKGVFLC